MDPFSEPVVEILQNYLFSVFDIKNESYKYKKGVWWLKTNQGTMILKKVPYSGGTLAFIIDAVRHLKEKGVLIPEIVKTSGGRSYAESNGELYVVSHAIEGKAPSYSRPEELKVIVEALAGFHKASSGFMPGTGTKPKRHLGTWKDDYLKQLEDFNIFTGTFRLGRSSNKIEALVAREHEYYKERASRAIEELDAGEYKAWVGKAELEGSLCHQDFAAGNLILDSEGKIYVLDTDSITIDIAARDIRKLVNKVMKKKGSWDRNILKTMLGAYQKINPLSKDQWKVVSTDLRFPHLFFGAVNKYHYRRDSEWTDEKYHLRIAEMAVFEKSSEELLNCFEENLN